MLFIIHCYIVDTRNNKFLTKVFAVVMPSYDDAKTQSKITVAFFFLISIAADLWQQLDVAFELESDLEDIVLLISVLEKLSLFCLTGLITLVLLM